MSQTVERFALPEQLPATAEELNALLEPALAQINLVTARARAGEKLSDDDVVYLRQLLEARDKLTTEIAAVEEAEARGRQELADLLERATGAPPAAETEEQPNEPAAAEAAAATTEAAATETAVPAPAETVVEATVEAVETAPGTEVVSADGTEVIVPPRGADGRPVNFVGLGANDPPTTPAGPGWRMRVGAPGYVTDPVGFAHIGRALDGQLPKSRKIRGASAQSRGSYMAQVIADLKRDAPVVADPHKLVEEIEKATTQVPKLRGSNDRVPVSAESLVAAGGWCAPSETLYDFCDVPAATDLISVPEITIVRGGVRWPVEPDLTSIFESFEFFFTEVELEATDSDNDPTARKECVDIPCPSEFEEMRLNVVGYCVEAGILQTQGWPELITWFTQQLVAEHLRAISRRTILDMVQGSTLETFSSTYLIGTAGAVLNSMALMATNLRLTRGLSRTAAIEAVAPSWLYEIIRADLAYYEHIDEKAVDDATIQRWFSARNIYIQLVGDWQTRATGLPGNLATVTWPGSVDVLMYPAGTWFRAMQNVIELGVMYPKEELVVNRYTRMFTEDAIAVGSRCYPSLVARIPLNVNGGIGNRYSLTAPSFNVSSGSPFSGAPVSGGPSDFTQGNVYSLTVSGGTPTSGTITLALTPTGGSALPGTAFNWNAEGWQVRNSLEGILGFTSDDFFVTSQTAADPGTGQLPTDVLLITVPMGVTLSVSAQSLNNSATAAVALVTTGLGE